MIEYLKWMADPVPGQPTQFEPQTAQAPVSSDSSRANIRLTRFPKNMQLFKFSNLV